MASDVFNILYRIDANRMVSQGYEYGEAGVRSFTETYGVLETITTIEPQENACSKAKVTKRVKERPGASPLLFGRFLMDIGAFVSLEDISANLPPYTEEVVSVPSISRRLSHHIQLRSPPETGEGIEAGLGLVVMSCRYAISARQHNSSGDRSSPTRYSARNPERDANTFSLLVASSCQTSYIPVFSALNEP